MELTEHQFNILNDAIVNYSYGYGDNGRMISYSGRFMYGRSCLGIAAEYPFNALAAILMFVVDHDSDLAAMLATNTINHDSLGLSTVIYWPALSIPANLAVTLYADN